MEFMERDNFFIVIMICTQCRNVMLLVDRISSREGMREYDEYELFAVKDRPTYVSIPWV